MKKYLNPNLEVLKLDEKDIVATSVETMAPPSGGGANDTPPVGVPLLNRE